MTSQTWTTNHLRINSSTVKWFFRMFISFFVKKLYHHRVFRYKMRSIVITHYIWQRETCPLVNRRLWLCYDVSRYILIRIMIISAARFRTGPAVTWQSNLRQTGHLEWICNVTVISPTCHSVALARIHHAGKRRARIHCCDNIKCKKVKCKMYFTWAII